MGILDIDVDKVSDEKFLYLKYFIDLNGNLIYAKRIKDNEEELNEMEYQLHPELAEEIINENDELKAIWKKLNKEFPDLIRVPIQFIVYWGYVLVNILVHSYNWIAFDSVTTPEEIINKINKEDPGGIYFQRTDVAKKYNSDEEYTEICKLHKRIQEEKLKLEHKHNNKIKNFEINDEQRVNVANLAFREEKHKKPETKERDERY